jgi:selenophosphate synthase
MICLGCAAKVDLVETVYPVLAELGRAIRASAPITLQPRQDVYIFDSDGRIEVERGVYALDDLVAGRDGRVEEDVRRARPDGAILLASFTANPSRQAFLDGMLAYARAAGRARHPFTLGKGHTVQLSRTPAEQLIMVDYVRSGRGGLRGVANNDTISTIDPNLPHSSWISVFVALNNALNDLLLCGVTQNLTFYPSYDGRTSRDESDIRDALARYQERFRELDVRMVDRGPLGFGLKAIGATITGTTDREVPRNEGLLEGQMLIATRPAGDLAPLTLYLIRQALGEETGDLEDLRLRVLGEMLAPNVEAARLIARYLPPAEHAFDPARHITATRDMSGPGILALEELAQDSGRDVYLHDLALHEAHLAEVEMPNPSAGTNGAIIIAAHEEVAREVWRDLVASGHHPWLMGEVLASSATPAVQVREDLARFPFLASRRRPFFSNGRFVPARPLPSPAPPSR